MKTYIVTMKHDHGTTKIKVHDVNSPGEAKRIACQIKGASLRSVVAVHEA